MLLLTACTSPDPPAPSPWFQEISESVGIDFKHVRAESSNFYFPEIMSGGVGWIDYDGDGWLDLYFVQGGDIDQNQNDQGTRYTNRLYRNIEGKRFEDVTEQAGVGDVGYGMGVAVGDIDNDGDADLYVTNVGPNVLYLNNGDGTFTDISASAGVNHPGWGASTAFADYDGDGLLDLYVVNYIHWAPHQEIECFSGGAGRDYCHPDNYRASASDILYRNEGNGQFVDVTQESGINQVAANGLGVVPADLNGDHNTDFYVANDGNPNQLWINNGDGTFTDRALIAGIAVNRQGTAEAGMGVIAFDLENDGDIDLFLSHLRDETNTLYRNDGSSFQDVTIAAGLSAPSLPYTGFGLGIADFDHDGHLDIYVVNGKVGRGANTDHPDPFAEPNQLFRGIGQGRFEEVAPPAGLTTNSISTSRGLATADFDNDGDVDVAVVNNHGHAFLLENIAAKKGTWIGFEVTSEQNASGSYIKIETQSHAYHRLFNGAGSYQSSNAMSVHAGIPGGEQVKSIEITWPDGEVQALTAFEMASYNKISRSKKK